MCIAIYPNGERTNAKCDWMHVRFVDSGGTLSLSHVMQAIFSHTMRGLDAILHGQAECNSVCALVLVHGSTKSWTLWPHEIRFLIRLAAIAAVASRGGL